MVADRPGIFRRGGPAAFRSGVQQQFVDFLVVASEAIAPGRVTETAAAAEAQRVASSSGFPSASADGQGAVESVAGSRGVDRLYLYGRHVRSVLSDQLASPRHT